LDGWGQPVMGTSTPSSRTDTGVALLTAGSHPSGADRGAGLGARRGGPLFPGGQQHGGSFVDQHQPQGGGPVQLSHGLGSLLVPSQPGLHSWPVQCPGAACPYSQRGPPASHPPPECQGPRETERRICAETDRAASHGGSYCPRVKALSGQHMGHHWAGLRVAPSDSEGPQRPNVP
jgi:hypothetical protein